MVEFKFPVHPVRLDLLVHRDLQALRDHKDPQVTLVLPARPDLRAKPALPVLLAHPVPRQTVGQVVATRSPPASDASVR